MSPVRPDAVPAAVPVGELADLLRGRARPRRPADAVPTALAPRATPPRVIAVDGPSGSGKSTLAARLAPVLDPVGRTAPVVAMDDLYPGWNGLADAVPRLCEWVLRPLAEGGPARYRRFDWPLGQYGGWREVPTAPWVIVEGVGSGSRACAPYLDAVVWIEAERDVRLRRGLDRDGELFRPHWLAWAAQEDRLFAANHTRERADVVVDGDPRPAPPCGLVVLRRRPSGPGRESPRARASPPE